MKNALKYNAAAKINMIFIIVDLSDPFGPSGGLFAREFAGNCSLMR